MMLRRYHHKQVTEVKAPPAEKVEQKPLPAEKVEQKPKRRKKKGDADDNAIDG